MAQPVQLAEAVGVGLPALQGVDQGQLAADQVLRTPADVAEHLGDVTAAEHLAFHQPGGGGLHPVERSGQVTDLVLGLDVDRVQPDRSHLGLGLVVGDSFELGLGGAGDAVRRDGQTPQRPGDRAGHEDRQRDHEDQQDERATTDVDGLLDSGGPVVGNGDVHVLRHALLDEATEDHDGLQRREQRLDGEAVQRQRRVPVQERGERRAHPGLERVLGAQVELVLRVGEVRLRRRDDRLDLAERLAEQRQRQRRGGLVRLVPRLDLEGGVGEVAGRLADQVVGAHRALQGEDLLADAGGEVGVGAQPQAVDHRRDDVGEVADHRVGVGQAVQHVRPGAAQLGRQDDRRTERGGQLVLAVEQVGDLLAGLRALHHQGGLVDQVHQEAGREQALLLQFQDRGADLGGEMDAVRGALRLGGRVGTVDDDRHCQGENTQQRHEHQQGKFAQDAELTEEHRNAPARRRSSGSRRSSAPSRTGCRRRGCRPGRCRCRCSRPGLRRRGCPRPADR